MIPSTMMNGDVSGPTMDCAPPNATRMVVPTGPHSDLIGLTASIKTSVHDGTPPTSTLEDLPTELVQLIASHLLREYQGNVLDTTFIGHTNAAGFDGLLELRATSRLMRAMTTFTFERSVATLIVGYDDQSLEKLWVRSQTPEFALRVRDVVFVTSNGVQYASVNQGAHWESMSDGLKTPEITELILEHPLHTSLVVAALRRFRWLTAVRIAPSLNLCYPIGVSYGSVGEHPPTSILNAALLAGVPLEELEMGTCGWGYSGGVTPATLWRSLYQVKDRAHLQTLTTLALGISNGEPQLLKSNFIAMRTLLERCPSLKVLELSLDKATTNARWPILNGARRMCIALAGQRYKNLHTLKLTGFALDPLSLHHFLKQHEPTLRVLWFGNCSLTGSWAPILYAIRFSPILQELVLHQISQGIRRVLWPGAVSFPLRDLHGHGMRSGVAAMQSEDEEDLDDWVYVAYVGHQTVGLDFKGRDVGEVMKTIFLGGRIAGRTTDPRHDDATCWGGELLWR